MKYQTVEILNEETYRSKPLVNMTNDMVKVTLTCSRNEWHEIKRHLINTEETMRCLNCCGFHLMDEACPQYHNSAT